VLGKDSSSVARSLENLGIARYELGDFSGAVASHRRAHAIKQRTLPPGHPRLAASLANLGTSLLALGQLDEAVAAYREAVLILSRGAAAGTVDLWNVRAGLGDTLAAVGAHDAAIAEYRAALAGYDSSDAGEGEGAATARVALARLLLHQARPEVAAARAQLEVATRALEAGADRDHAVQALANLLMCDLLEGHAVGPKLQALEEASSRAGRLEASTAVYVDYVRARALARLGRREEARHVAATARAAAAQLVIPLHPRGLRWLSGLR
jgi:tetratricopeptide (TPR) repeat protein